MTLHVFADCGCCVAPVDTWSPATRAAFADDMRAHAAALRAVAPDLAVVLLDRADELAGRSENQRESLTHKGKQPTQPAVDDDAT